MRNKHSHSLQGEVHTLAQTGTGILQPVEKIVMGKGSDLTDKKAWKGRAKRKGIGQALSVHLINVVQMKGEPERTKPYWNTFHCQSRLIQYNDRTYGTYCKNRFCPLCNSIRKADIINRYLPEIKTWEDPHFITLTVKAAPAERLAKWFRGIDKAFRQIREKLKKRHQRGKGPKFMGIKSLECNFNPSRKTYNPHLHLIVPNKAVADLLVAEWLLKWTPQFTLPLAQKVRRVRCVETDMVETIKYGSKVFTDFDARKKGQLPKGIYVAALDNIYQAMKPYRQFERFGFNLPKQRTDRQKQALPADECKDLVFAVEVYDWVNVRNGEGLTGYAPTAELEWLLMENVDLDLQ
jgi:hypothetical protein